MRSMHGLGGHYMRVPWRVGLVLLVGVIAPATVLADADAEREILARFIHEIEALGPLIETAEAQAMRDAGIRFRYDWLRQDLSRIRAGIQDHINAPQAEPRAIPPLRGDYRQ
jgi:RAQPRD family integrative conjugative element protein